MSVAECTNQFKLCCNQTRQRSLSFSPFSRAPTRMPFSFARSLQLVMVVLWGLLNFVYSGEELIFVTLDTDDVGVGYVEEESVLVRGVNGLETTLEFAVLGVNGEVTQRKPLPPKPTRWGVTGSPSEPRDFS